MGNGHLNPAHLDTLAEALYANGDYPAALKTELQAIALLSPEKKIYYEKQLNKYQRAVKDKSRCSDK